MFGADREADLSAVATRAQAPSRFPFADGDQERPEDRRSPPRQGPQAPDGLTARAVDRRVTDAFQLDRLKRRPQFLAAAKGRSEARGAVVVQMLDRADGSDSVGLGFTATRKVGGAVVRNRAKRRLREAARLLTPAHALAGRDYVFIARMGTVDRPWDRLLDDVKWALTRLATPRAASPAASSGRPADPLAVPQDSSPR